jgi:hypothetical protein
MSEWISVKDRLPFDKFQEVICVISDGDIPYSTSLTWREHNGESSPCGFYYYQHSKYILMDEWVTHWMPLPEPPKQ